MKITLLFLVLVNALFYGWSHWVAQPSGDELAATPEVNATPLTLYAEAFPDEQVAELDVTALVLPDESPPAAAPEPATASATELPPEPEPEAQAQPVREAQSVVVEAAPPRCVELGPFLRLREATEAAARLRESGLEPGQRLEEAEVWVGHWVYLAAFPSRAAAIAEVERLREGGITDNYIETSGELRNAISLGLFSNRDRAEARAQQARELGVSLQIRDRFRTGTVYWLDFDLPAEQVLDLAEFSTQPNRPVELKDRECGTAG